MIGAWGVGLVVATAMLIAVTTPQEQMAPATVAGTELHENRGP
jgi:hypothetical protein